MASDHTCGGVATAGYLFGNYWHDHGLGVAKTDKPLLVLAIRYFCIHKSMLTFDCFV